MNTKNRGTTAERFLGAVALTLAILGFGSEARATVFVTAQPTLGSPLPSFTITQLPGGKWRVALTTTVIAQPTTFIVRGDTTDRIETITVNAMVPQTVFVEVRGQSVGTPLQSVDLIDIGASTATVIVNGLRTTGDVGSIFVNTISSTNIGGDVTGDIVLVPRGGGGESTLIGATINGRIRGDVLCDNGAIFGLTASAGIGAPGAPSLVRTKNNIVRIVAASIYADITTLSNGGAGVTGEVRTTSGPFVGSLSTAALRSTGTGEPGVLSIFGDLDADITITGAVSNDNGGLPVISVGGVFPAGRRLVIGTDLSPGAELRIASAQGLKGQVLVNFNNWNHAWSGPVRVGGTLLGPIPEYSQTSAAIGGGAVGQAPFALHGPDSFPARGQVVPASTVIDINNPIRLRYYGPITWITGASLPVTIQRRPIADAQGWIDQSACFFAGREASSNPNIIALFPVRRLTGGFVYRVKPVLAGGVVLQSDIGSGFNPPVAAATNEYTFTLLGGCAGDADGDGIVNFSDITSVLSNWGSVNCLASGDANASGSIDFSDITTVLSNWGAVCSTAAEAPGGGVREAGSRRAWRRSPGH